MVYVKKGYNRNPEVFKRMVATRMKNGSYVAWNKGKKLGTFEEQFGKEKADEMNRKHTESAKKYYKEHPEVRKKISLQLLSRPVLEHFRKVTSERMKLEHKLGLRKEAYKKHAKSILGKKNPKTSETRKRLFKEGKLKAWNVGMTMADKYPHWGKRGKRDEKERLRLKEMRLNQIFPKQDTTIEVKIQYLLKQLGIEHLTHFYIKEIEHSYRCDILIPVQEGINQKTIIECDGDYWHGNPIKFSNPNKLQLDHIERDKIRTQELIDKGFRVIRLWEHEIRSMNIEELNIKLRC